MEVTGGVFRQAPGFCSTTADAHNSRHCHSLSRLKKPNSFHPKQQLNRKSFAACVISDEFSDKGHLHYYNGPRMAVKEKEEMGSKKKKEMKKKLKLLKGLSKNLSTFSEMGFGLHLDDGLDQQVKGQMISEATEVLLGQVQKLKEEKMESKRMKKEEKAKKKASRMMMRMTDCKGSSSSESSSSESDCGTVVNMSQLKTNTSNQDEPSPLKILEKAESRVTSGAIGGNVYVDVGEEESCGKKIEVCVGGKCKKSGGAMLLENFQKAVGGGAEVVGCKCMGKCREGPNVKVHNDEVSITTSLCIGVGIEDVDSIVSNVFGGSQRSSSFPALSGV